jgi:Ca2+/H+ antiporter, TMEM165/GDT1 family
MPTLKRIAQVSACAASHLTLPHHPPHGSILVSTGIVAIAEIGDKTQLLAFLLATRFKKPLPIIVGLLVATLINHGLAGIAGVLVTSWIEPRTLRWILGASFVAMAAWTVIPDKMEESIEPSAIGAFGATLISFFLAEIGDKTQIATIGLAAKYNSLFVVVAGTTLGMMVADVPAVVFGDRIAQRVPLRLIRGVTAAIFVARQVDGGDIVEPRLFED